jgi:hypothetical protein
MRRVLGALAQIIAAIIISFLFGQVAVRLVPTTDRLFFSICTVGAYILGVVIGVYFTAEILDINGNFWFLLVGAVLSGILVFAAFSFERFISQGLWSALTGYATSVALVGPVLATFAFNIGPKTYGRR